ncbi:MAG: hypothetical protein WC197_05760 [Candidatus Gastranaerophilaceae bacterium]|jgi:hypothetical protein
MGFLDSLKAKKKATIGISISSKSILEIAEFDFGQKKILKYTNVTVNYNTSTRQFDDINELESSIKNAFEELGLSLNSNVFLSLPTTLINHQTLPNILDEESIRMAISSEVEKNYVFKKYEPQVSYVKISENADNETSFIVFTAFQAELIQQLKSLFEKIGLNLLAIDTSYASLIRGITESGIIDQNIMEESNWNLLLINTNSYVIFSMIGDKLFEVYEDPIAIKSFSEDEIYPAITSSASSSLVNYPSEHLVIISESDDVSAEILSNYLNFSATKSYIECNRYTQKPIVEYDLTVLPTKAPMISPEIVGICCWSQSSSLLKFNFNEAGALKEYIAQSIIIAGHEIEITPKLLQNIAIGFIAFSLILISALWYISESIISIQTRAIQEISSKISELQTSLDANKVGHIIPSAVIDEIYNNNKNVITSYDSLAIDIPEKLWIEEFEVYSDLSTYIKGKALKMDDILGYYESLQKLGKFKDFKITSLKIADPTAEKNAASSTLSTPPSLLPMPPAPPTTGSVLLPPVSNVSTSNNLEFFTSVKTYEFVFGVQKSATPQPPAPVAAPSPPAAP